MSVYCIDLTTKNYWYKSDLNFLSFFNRSSVEELLREFSIVAAESLEHDPERKIFGHKDLHVCCHRVGNLVAILVTDLEYPTRVSFELLRRVHEDSSQEHLAIILNQCQDPYTVDALMRTQKQLDETIVVMHENVDKILQRGENIDELVEKSARLSAQSKAFYKAARQHNRCCGIQ